MSNILYRCRLRLGALEMFMPMRHKFPVLSWLIPTLLFLSIATLAVYDYTQQHVKVTVFGTVVDTADVSTVIIQPPSNVSQSQRFYRVSGHGDIVGILKQLSNVAETSGDKLLPADDPLASLYVTLSKSNILQIRLYQSSVDAQKVWVEFNNKVYAASHQLTDYLTNIEQNLKG